MRLRPERLSARSQRAAAVIEQQVEAHRTQPGSGADRLEPVESCSTPDSGSSPSQSRRQAAASDAVEVIFSVERVASLMAERPQRRGGSRCEGPPTRRDVPPRPEHPCARRAIRWLSSWRSVRPAAPGQCDFPRPARRGPHVRQTQCRRGGVRPATRSTLTTRDGKRPPSPRGRVAIE